MFSMMFSQRKKEMIIKLYIKYDLNPVLNSVRRNTAERLGKCE